MGLVNCAHSLAKVSGFSVWQIEKRRRKKQTNKKVNPLRLGNLFSRHNGTIQNSPIYELQHIICKNCFSLSYLSPAKSTHWVTRSEQEHFDKFCFHDDELTSEKGEVLQDLYSVEYSQMFACFHFQPFSSHGSVPGLVNLPVAVFPTQITGVIYQ